MSRLRARVLFLVWLASTKAASIPSVFQRDDSAVCGVDNYRQCSGGLDEGLCCAENRACVFLAGGSTVVCCPDSSCDQLAPISCDVSLQDASKYPQRQLKTTALQAELPRCGENCCPFGYTCNDEGQCDMNEDQSKRPSERSAEPSSSTRTAISSVVTSILSTTISPSDTTTSTVSESTTGVATTTATSITTNPSQQPDAEEQKSGDDDGVVGDEDDPFPTAPVVIGVLAGVFILTAAAVGLFMYLARRRNKKKKEATSHSEKKGLGRGIFRTSSSTSSFGNIISDPIPREESALRTDFILKTPERHSRESQRLSSLSQRDSLNVGGATAVVPRDLLSSSSNGDTSAGLGRTYGSQSGSRPPRIPVRTLTNATMTTASRHAAARPGIAIPPIRTMRNQQKPTINQGGAWGDGGLAARAAALEATTPTDPRPATPRLQREPSSESINVFADPGTVGTSHERRGDAAAGMERPQMVNRFTSGTTFTDLMEEAQLGDVRRGNPYVPGTPGRTPRLG
ncbi:hypothetical protein ACRALDRAFT_2059530 [Sodiomyces alcalophilus JCM 7366]|uniref:uncharacterized protein n=1 Tax=Sodiomyces alcalophilus JCM 7366 TaxID=591952 RepID=UPI0039B3898E